MSRGAKFIGFAAFYLTVGSAIATEIHVPKDYALIQQAIAAASYGDEVIVAPGGNVQLKIVGIPGSTPFGFWFSAGVMDPPIISPFGEWYLKFPVLGPIVLGTVPVPGGVAKLSGTLPATPPGPYTIYFQSLVGSDLTNLCSMRVE